MHRFSKREKYALRIKKVKRGGKVSISQKLDKSWVGKEKEGGVLEQFMYLQFLKQIPFKIGKF